MPTYIEGQLDILSRFRGGLVEQNGDLTVDVKSCFYDIGGTKGQYGGASNQAVTDDDTNYVYLDNSAVLQINTTGYPGTNHIRLAKVFAANGTITSINDERAFLTIQDADSAHSHSNKAQLDLLTDGDHDARTDNPHSVTAAQASAANVDHDATHISAGSDEIDGDKLDIDWNPANYTPATTPTEVTSVDHLTAHLYGIDQVLASAGGGQTNTVAGSNGITNTGDNVDAVLTPTYGSSVNTICQGNDSRLVTNGNSHDHNGGDGAQIDHVNLANKGTNTHAQLDTHVAATNNPHATDVENLGSGTLAELNAAITDATLGTLTSTAPANVTKAAAAAGTATEVSRQDHKHDVTTAAAVAVGTANAEGSATTLARSDHTHQVTGLAITSQAKGDIIYYNGSAWVRLAAGTSGHFLKTQGAAANPVWAAASGGGGFGVDRMFQADQLESPNSSDWKINALAPLIVDSSNNALTVRAFDDSSEEGVGFTARVPTGATNMILGFLARAATAPTIGPDTVALNLYSRAVPDNAVIPAWSTETSLTDISIPENAYYQKDSQTISISTLGLTAGVTYTFELTRDYDDGDDLSGDWLLHSLTVGWS